MDVSTSVLVNCKYTRYPRGNDWMNDFCFTEKRDQILIVASRYRDTNYRIQ